MACENLSINHAKLANITIAEVRITRNKSDILACFKFVFASSSTYVYALRDGYQIAARVGILQIITALEVL